MGVATAMLVATGNRHKVGEIRSILGREYPVWSMADVLNPPRLVEEASTFAGNAVAKATQLARYLAGAPGSFPAGLGSEGLRVLADDSGLEVDALGGAPGVHSARFAHLDGGGNGNATDAENNAKLMRLLDGVPEERRTARFRCVLALLPLEWASAGGEARLGEAVMFEGVCEGRIGFEPRGVGGFGYDPLFHPLGQEGTFAELGEEIKNRLSHRYRALERMRSWLGLRSGSGIA
jgi:XTP/dITP diphosphohydrolase